MYRLPSFSYEPPAGDRQLTATSVSQKASQFQESVIREMTRRCVQLHGADAVNFAQGFPDFDAPAELIEAAVAALRDGHNQYARTWGAPPLSTALARQYGPLLGREIDPDREITVTCGSTEAMICAMLSLVDPGDEVIVFSPFYENYGPDCILSGAAPRFVTLHEPDWRIDVAELERAFNPRTRAIVVNTPNNPTGKVYSRAEMELIADLCRRYDAIVITDEIYEHLVYEGEHVRMAALPGMYDRTVTISGISKTYSLTGWRVGWMIANPHLTGAIRKVHDFLTVGAAHPLQVAAVAALELPDAYYAKLLADYRERRNTLVGGLTELGFGCAAPAGAYYVMADFSAFGFPDDLTFANHLVEALGVATVPGSSFYHLPELGERRVRFSYPKKLETIRRGLDRLAQLPRAGA
ncbi:MAG TPA: aminotransferase class I/II-fold pyridoxal phosphate-dependent enzyme [Candidatus Dormibacteraeota bacterium]|nr:aminotransferase class I/II-fold pyridoxal phosphate-dependent enzyme [Candidatus Dormibacteraeota bacterium]